MIIRLFRAICHQHTCKSQLTLLCRSDSNPHHQAIYGRSQACECDSICLHPQYNHGSPKLVDAGWEHQISEYPFALQGWKWLPTLLQSHWHGTFVHLPFLFHWPSSPAVHSVSFSHMLYTCSNTIVTTGRRMCASGDQLQKRARALALPAGGWQSLCTSTSFLR